MKIVNIIRDSFIECAPFTWGISLFSFGCNLRCDFCKGYNYETVTNEKNIIGDVIEILESEVTPAHDCVIFIGGEPTIWGKDLMKALQWCKDNGKKTKIFSNGYAYNTIKEINDLGLCDAWSIDYKGLKNKVGAYIGVSSDEYFNNLTKTLTDIISRNIPLEIRTTYFDDNLEDRENIRKEIKELERFMEEKEFNSYYKYFEQEDFRKKIYKES